jgi:hypothetical protein
MQITTGGLHMTLEAYEAALKVLAKLELAVEKAITELETLEAQEHSTPLKLAA